MDEEKKYWLGFSAFPGIGPLRFKLLKDYLAQINWKKILQTMKDTFPKQPDPLTEFTGLPQFYDGSGFKLRVGLSPIDESPAVFFEVVARTVDLDPTNETLDAVLQALGSTDNYADLAQEADRGNSLTMTASGIPDVDLLIQPDTKAIIAVMPASKFVESITS